MSFYELERRQRISLEEFLEREGTYRGWLKIRDMEEKGLVRLQRTDKTYLVPNP